MDNEVVKALALPTLPNLKEIQNACLNDYGTSKNTKKAYKGHLASQKRYNHWKGFVRIKYSARLVEYHEAL